MFEFPFASLVGDRGDAPLTVCILAFFNRIRTAIRTLYIFSGRFIFIGNCLRPFEGINLKLLVWPQLRLELTLTKTKFQIGFLNFVLRAVVRCDLDLSTTSVAEFPGSFSVLYFLYLSGGFIFE